MSAEIPAGRRNTAEEKWQSDMKSKQGGLSMQTSAVSWEVVKSRKYVPILTGIKSRSVFIQNSAWWREFSFQFYCHWVIWGSILPEFYFSPVSLLVSGSQFAAKVFWCCIQQPVGIHQTQVSHVAAGGVQQLVEDHVCWLGLEKDRGRVDGHRLVGVQSQVAAVRLQLRSIDKHPMGKAAANVPRLRPTRLQLQVQLNK